MEKGDQENVHAPLQSSLAGLNEGYDQPADPPSYSQATDASTGQALYPQGAYMYPTQYSDLDNTNQYAYQPDPGNTNQYSNQYPSNANQYAYQPDSGNTNQYSNQYPGNNTSVVVNNQPGATQLQIIVEPPPPVNYTKRAIVGLVCSILNCLFCCWPIGIVAIVFSSLAVHSATKVAVAEYEKYQKVSVGLNASAFIIGVIIYTSVLIVLMVGQ